ncbi:DNA polymerase I [[Clostridium] polysaccharolyticum]|uniref:DNA polymerase I n=1 Tax=[Clostridium] polysaccharolyticum TaxID=29364 RepID=A0A1I0AY60_9FIRM|nr:DNA polymerase I [[Clostridium] polysaccharolyticum]SES99461.1 DNA polymerase I [[Clostridium] polysaccharolyticum]
MSKKIVLIDGHSILNRAFYGIPELTNSKGLHTNAVYGFLNILFKLLDEEKADYLTVAFDVKHPTFRHEMFPEYKGTRKGMPEELREQVPLMKEVLKAMNIRIVEKPGFEADDILGTIAKKSEAEGYEVSVVSGDRDLLQLASDHIKIRIPKTKRTGTEIEDYNTKDVIEKMGIEPWQVIEMKALMGDTADNIPGVPGIGEKTALKILDAFKTLENAYEHIEEVMPNRAREALRNNYDLAKMSKALATIKTDCELEYKVEESKIENIYNETAFQIMKDLEFKSILRRFGCETVSLSNDTIEENFVKITKQADAKQIWDKITGSQGKKDFVLGFWLFQEDKKKAFSIAEDGQFSFAGLEEKTEETIYGVALSFEGDNGIQTCYISTEGDITSQEITAQLAALSLEGVAAVLDLKELLFKMPESCLSSEEQDPFFDCKVAAYLLNPLKDTYECDDIARDYVSLTIPSYADYFGKADLGQAATMPDFYKYACYNAYIAKMAYVTLEQELEQAEMTSLYYDIELPLITTLYDMEVRGVHVNKEELTQYGQRLGERIVTLESEIYEMAGEKFNINSPKQLGVILFEKMNMPFAKKTKTGYSTSADILDKLRCEHPVIGKILEYRQLTKLKSTYADGLTAYIQEDGRIHGKFNQTITATGRISSTEPNLQNIPIRMELGKEIRKVFVPKEGYVFLDADYSQIELRVLAHMCGDETLIEAYREGKDIHRITASQVFHIPFEEVTSRDRSNAKAVNFGIVYGSTAFGLSQNLNISKKEADEYIKKYFATYPRIKEFMDGLIETGKEKGYVETLYHRIRPVPELKSSNFMQKAAGERIAMNSPIQGTAADIIKIAMVRVNEKLKNLKMKSQLILQVHDELLVETHKDEIETVKKILKEEMFHAAQMEVPLEVDVQMGENWFEAH